MRRTASVRRTPSRRPFYCPELVSLESRLPLGDAALSLLTTAFLLGTYQGGDQASTPAALARASETGVAMPGENTVESMRLPTHPAVYALGDVLPPPLVTPAWTALTPPFAPSSPRQQSTVVPSPQREQGVDLPLLAQQAPEPAAPTVSSSTPSIPGPVTRSDGSLVALLAGWQAPVPAATRNVTPTQEAQVKENFGRLPLTFEQNVGQTDASVHFFTRGPGYGLYLTATEAVMVLNVAGSESDRMSMSDATFGDPVARVPGYGPEPSSPPAVIRMQFVGANATPTITGRDQQPGKINYFLGNDPAKWHTNISTFGRVEYDEVYPGIDLVYYGNQQQVEYDFVVSPGTNPNTIRLNISGAERLELDAHGDLVMYAGGQQLRQHKPFVYQDAHGTRQEVASRFVLDDGQVRFDVGNYDAGRALVIDPVLSNSTYLGGSFIDSAFGLAVNPATGEVLLGGGTLSVNFPVVNPLQAVNRGDIDLFVSRLSADGSALLYSSYLGGRGAGDGFALGVDPGTGDALLTGTTTSSDFPTVNPLQSNIRGCAGFVCDAFVTRLSADGSALIYSTYLGGNNNDFGTGIGVDPGTGDTVVTGYTGSTNFPNANPLQPVNLGDLDVFVTRLTANGSTLVFSTYLGGNGQDFGNALAVDPTTGDILLTGETRSTDFPTANPLQENNRGGFDVFVVRLSANGSALVFSTYLGGTASDDSGGLAVDPVTGDTLLTGSTASTNFPTANPLQTVNRGFIDTFVARLSADGSTLVYSTYLGGSGSDSAFDLTVDAVTGDTLLTGETGSIDFPTAHPLQASNRGEKDVFVARLTVDGSSLIYSTYLGGSGEDSSRALAVDPATGDALLAGNTFSNNFPTVNPLQPSNAGFRDAFVTRIGSSPVASYYVYPDSGEVQAGVPFDLYVYALDAAGNILPNYTGEIAFFSTDKLVTLPKPYTFLRTDQGVAYFFEGVTFLTPGTQELYVFDTATYKVWGYAVFEVI